MIVNVLPCQAHSLVFGGFELQMLEAIQAAQEAGVNIAPLNPWSKVNYCSILHCWGLSETHGTNIYWAKRQGKAVVVTALLPYLSRTRLIKAFLRKLRYGQPSVQRMVASIDRLVVVNSAQRDSAIKLYGFDANKIAIIPNIVHEDYFTLQSNAECEDQSRIKPVVCLGSICPRKNQLLLAKAAASVDLPLLLVGGVLPGEEAYASEIVKLINQHKNIRWIPGLPYHSRELLDIVRNSSGLALPSMDETQPISALEAAVAGKPLLLSDMAWGQQEFYAGAVLVDPNSCQSISNGLIKLTEFSQSNVKSNPLLNSVRSLSVGALYKKVYLQLAN